MPTQMRKTYLPHEMAAAIRRIARGNGSGSGGGTNLDSLSFGDMSAYELSAVATNPGATDPKWYEAIAEAINTVKERIASGEGTGTGTGSLSGSTDLDMLLFGELSASELSSIATNPGATDPKWYEAIAEAINTVKERGGTANLDALLFGELSESELAQAATNPGATDPKWYEAIAEAINTVKERGGSGHIYTDADEGKVVHNGKLVSLEAYLAETSSS